MPIDSLDKLFENELKDIYDAERRLTRALPKMAKQASSDELRQALEEHLQVTQTQIQRLEQIFGIIEKKPAGKTCVGMKGIIEEGEEMMQEDAPEMIADVALIGSARRVEHYEMASYLGLHALAQQMEQGEEIAQLIEQNLQEEEEADRRLEEICQTTLENAGMEDDEEEEEEDDLEDDEEEEEEEEEEEAVAQPARKAPAKAVAKKAAPARKR